MKRHLLAISYASVVLVLFLGGPAVASGGRSAQWHAFFAQVLPLVPKDFASIKGAYMPKDDVYAVKSHFDSKLVTGCHVFITGATPQWHMRCDTNGYTSADRLAADVGAALPGFTKGANIMGQPQWKDARHQTYVTLVALGGILITHGDPDAY
jgi:hypothetical protein